MLPSYDVVGNCFACTHPRSRNGKGNIGKKRATSYINTTFPTLTIIIFRKPTPVIINTVKMSCTERWINAAFSSSYRNEVYFFMGNKYVLIDYAPGTTNDKVINGPLSISDGFPSLARHFFAEWGIDCAFRSHHGNEAFIFSGCLCSLIDFAPHTKDDKILKGPMKVAQMFPFFKGTVFENGIDAAFESSIKDEAYLFKGNQYARINYNGSSARLLFINTITEGFHCLRGTIFESGFDVAFASHIHNEAYLFKGDTYVRINFAPGTSDDKILGGVRKILPSWPSLKGILPRKN